MIKPRCTIDLHSNNAWHTVAVLQLLGDVQTGYETPTRLAYDFDYALTHHHARDCHALAAALAVEFDFYEYDTWPPFLVDMLPQGYGRKMLQQQLQLPQGQAADWPLLLAGAGNSIGNLRIREAYTDLQARSQTSSPSVFSRNDIVQRADHFIDYLAGNGLYVAGSSGVQGEWPKVLVTEDAEGGWHLDHLLPDDRAARHWLVKLGRSDTPVYADILSAEAAYHAIATKLGIRTHGTLVHDSGVLFIPRFDRTIVDGHVIRHGQESLYSLCGLAGFGLPLTHNRAIAAMARYCTDPVRDIVEYVKRDVLNVAFGNKDNHGRNTAFQRLDNGQISLSPLFDFAPMLLHPDGIPRTIRWERRDGGMPDWGDVAEQVAETGIISSHDLRQRFGEWLTELQQLPDVLALHPLPTRVLERILPLIEEVKHGLQQAAV